MENSKTDQEDKMEGISEGKTCNPFHVILETNILICPGYSHDIALVFRSSRKKWNFESFHPKRNQ